MLLSSPVHGNVAARSFRRDRSRAPSRLLRQAHSDLPGPCFTGKLRFSAQNRGMNVVATVRALNQRAAKEKWYHYCDPSLAFSDHSYDHLLGVWRTKAGGRRMPRRSALTPRDLKDILPN